jgi:hypothetical protein
MLTTRGVPRQVHPDCRTFVAVVEELLERRQEERRLGGDAARTGHDAEWGLRKWHRTELEDMVYASYKRMRQGAITRPPRRQVVMDIADYLNCSLEERNRLLLAARLTPVERYHTGSHLQTLVTLSAEAAQPLPMPWMIINWDWRIHHVNAHLLALYDLSAEEVAAIAPERFNVLDLLFDPTLPFSAHLVDRARWRRMATLTVRGFRMANRFCEFDSWYRETVARLMTLPDFAPIWSQASIDGAIDDAPADVIFTTALPALHDSSLLARIRPLLISAGYFQFDFPRIIGFVPADSATRALFQRVELPFPAGSEGESDAHFVP